PEVSGRNMANMKINRHEVGYWPGECKSRMFGGNSNWRCPNCREPSEVLINTTELRVGCPTGSGDYMSLLQVAEEIQHRIIHIFGRDIHGRRALDMGIRSSTSYFHCDDGRGLGASHQTGWSGLIAYYILQSGVSYLCGLPSPRQVTYGETLDSQSEHGDDIHSLRSAFNANELNTLGDSCHTTFGRLVSRVNLYHYHHTFADNIH
ncbi:hypothetical protein H4582DRAFT_1928619, partial [Lactarius indigo]